MQEKEIGHNYIAAKAYIAEDGKRFDDKNECLSYERVQEELRAKKIVEQLQHFDCRPPEQDIEYHSVWYYVRSNEELDAVKIYEFANSDSAAYDFHAQCFPCWIRVTVEDDTGCGYIDSMDDLIAQYTDFIDSVKSLAKECAPKTYIVAIEETICQEFEIEATSEADARRIAESKYRSGELVVDDCCVMDRKMRAWSNVEDRTEWYPF